MTDNKIIAQKVARILDSKKAQDIVIIDISSKAGFADYFVICSASNERLIEALSHEAEDGLAKEGIFVKGIEGKKDSGWILMDYGDIIINIFSKEMRTRYNIEKIWGDCDFVEFEEE